jgi:hypothetical protein
VTSPENVGQVEVDLIASAKGLAASIRKEVESAFKGLDFDKLIRDSIGNKPIKISVTADVDASGISEKVKEAPVPKVKVDVDPVLSAFQAELRAQVNALARTVNAKVPVGAETGGLRAELGAQLAEIQHSISVDVPTEPGSRAEYEAKLKAQLEEVKHRVKQSVDVDVDTNGAGGFGGPLSGLSSLTNGLPGLGVVSSGLSTISDALTKLATQGAQTGAAVGGSFATAAGPVGLIIGLLVTAAGSAVSFGGAVVGGVTIAIPAITALAGAIASIPGLLTGAAAGIGTLFLGFKGITDAFKPKPAGGGGGGAGQSAAQQARQVAAASRQVEAARRGIVSANRAYEASERSLAAAERGVATAQRALVDAEDAVAAAQKRAQAAQTAVNKARAEAVDDLIDMNLQLKDSRLSEEEASLAVTDALRDLNAVKLTGNIPDIQKADLAYQRAQLTLEEATQSTKELGKQTADANAKGVEGSDKVQSALKEQADALDGVKKAQEGVTDAQNGILDAADSLKSAQDGVASAADGIKSATDSLASAQDSLAQAQTKQAAAGAAAGQQLTKLAPAAQSFVNALKALKPAFENLRLDVQQKLFDGLDKTVTNLGKAWIPALTTTLGNYAATFNSFFKNLGASISTPQFITDIQTGAEGARQLLEKVGGSITDHLIPAFGTLSAASAPFLSHLGDLLADVVTKFSNWVQSAKGEKLSTFFDHASKAFDDIFAIGGTVASIIGSIISIVTGAAPGTGDRSPLDAFKDGLQKIADYLADPKNQGKIEDFIKKVEGAVTRAEDLANRVAGVYNGIRGILGPDNGESLGADIGAGIITGIISVWVGGTNLLADAVIGYLQLMLDRVKDFLGIHSPSTVFADIGSNLIDGLILGIQAAFGALAAAAGQIPVQVIAAVGNAGQWLLAHGQNAVIGLENGIGKQLGNLSSYAGNIKATVQNRLSDAGSWLSAHGGNAVIGFINGIGGRLGSVSTAARNIAAYAINALNSLYGSMLTIGSNVVIGLYNGIAGMGSWLYNKLISFARAVIPGPIAAALGINSPSKVAAELGGFVSQGLALGITAEGDRVQAAADEIAAKAVPQVPDVTFGLGAMADAKLSASLEAASSQQLQVGWKVGTTGDQFLDALANVIDIKYGGSVTRALTRK